MYVLVNVQVLRPTLCFALVAFGSAGGCTGSSPYTASWVSTEVGNHAGQAVPVRKMAGRRDADRWRATLPPTVKNLALLSEDDAVSVALWNNVSFRADLTQLGFSRADLADATAIPNPNLSFLFPMSTRQFELSAQYPVATLLQRPWRMASATYDVEKTARALVQNGLDVMRDVRIAWAELEASGGRKQLRIRAHELVRQSAELAASRYQNGDVSALEADLVRAESLAAAELAQRAEREESVARARLRWLMGLAQSSLGEHLGVRTPEIPTGSPASLPTFEKAALASRPDLRAAEIALEAAGERAGLEKARIAQFFARVDAKPVGPNGGGPQVWQPGFTTEIPIFNQNPGGRARAQAEVERAAWTYVALCQQVVTDVRLAYEELSMALASRQPWTTSIVPLQERNVAAAVQAYEAGAEAYLVVLEATRRLVEAKLRELELGLDVRRSRARLERAVGWRIHASP